MLPRTPRLGLSLFLWSTAPSGLWTTGIKKVLATPSTQLGSHVSKARTRVTEAPARHVDMSL
jgi:hypothetical protein